MFFCVLSTDQFWVPQRERKNSLYSEFTAKETLRNFSSTLEHWEFLLPKLLTVTKNNTQTCGGAPGSEIPCVCDPFLPMTGRMDKWFAHHAELARTAEAAPADLDVVFLGDSIIEHWNGTKFWGRRLMPEKREEFQRRFSKASGAKLEGIALGAAQDVVQNLNWHVQNGLIPDSINPKVVWILIGTNNFAMNCSTPDVVVSAIMEVAMQIRIRKPHVKIVVQGILPRGDSLGSRELNEAWKSIQQANERLQLIAEALPQLYYFGLNSSLFFTQENGRTLIDKLLLKDCVHPTAAGYAIMGEKIEAELLRLLS
jgi:lysophospholipase L1-like esterase